MDLYKLVYFEAEQSFQSGGPLQGLLFWRWNAIKNVDLGTSGVPGTSAQTVDTDSPTFQQAGFDAPASHCNKTHVASVAIAPGSGTAAQACKMGPRACNACLSLLYALHSAAAGPGSRLASCLLRTPPCLLKANGMLCR